MSDQAPKPASNPTLDSIAQHLSGAVLPGDAGFEGAALEEAAAFVLKAAQSRNEGRASLLLESHADERRFLRIAIINENMPFLVDSIAATITGLGISIHRLLHPIVNIERDANDVLIGVGSSANTPEGTRESLVYIETARVDARQRRDMIAQLRQTLADVRSAVTDWPKLQEAMGADAGALSSSEHGANRERAALLEWLNGGMLTQLGHVTRQRDGTMIEPKGVCCQSAKQILAEATFERAFQWFDSKGPEHDLLLIKTNRISNVHRRVPLDLFMVAHRKDGKTASISIHAGVWTSAALASPPNEVPILRSQLAQITSDMGFDPGSHAGKALIHAFTVLPHDLLVAFNPSDICDLATALMSLIDRPRPKLVQVRSQLERHVFAFVWLPRDLLSTQTRLQIQQMLTRTPGTSVLDWSLEVQGGSLAMLQFQLDIRSSDLMLETGEIESELEDMLRGWGDAVEHHLAEYDDSTRVPAIAAKYCDAFPQSYRTRYGALEAALDIMQLRGLDPDSETPERSARLYTLPADPPNGLRLKLYHPSGALALSDAVPALENFGFTVLAEVPTKLDEGALGTIHEFALRLPDGEDAARLMERAAGVETAIAAVLNSESENDSFNRLVVGAALDARDANLMRAFYRYLRQIGMGFTIYTVVDALDAAPDVTAAMIELFAARHDPAFDGDRKKAAKAALSKFNTGLSKVAAINDDRLLRLYQAVLDAILRTNFYAGGSQEALAFKIDSALIPNLPKPVPWREIFVYSSRVEGIHLRSGPVARGGLRWSDRRDDFRTEILGLMKAQRVKNAVIVPAGAKGGFYPKQLPSPTKDREAWAAEGQASYEIFIRTLLSVTDNIVDDVVVHPNNVVINDGEDPYFVVAADKGTARFSDVANGIAQGADFWLDDAFASGGSNGYDHKAMGITARGAWVSVQRHFLEMGIDVQRDSVRVAGCGDMSGDVFGNGLLLSKAVKLVAAFDHRHVFIDPDPDPAASWDERKRLFDLPRSSWDDYDKSLISKGGGVFARDQKSITLPEETRQMLGLDKVEVGPDALVTAVLKAQVDLLWFGGIGTYIKAAHENHAEVGDPANDALRIDAREVGAKVIGEGANLGTTQAGRIAFALKGGRINTDFIDNSAGVDCSDNEVNIKIALAAARRAGELSDTDRNALLEEMTDEVADIVLEDNRLQALALSIAEAGGSQAIGPYVHLIDRFEASGDLDRTTEGLAQSDALMRRAGDGHGLTRPELAVLLSTAKLVLQDAIEASDLPDDPALESTLIGMFPAPMREPFGAQIRQHRLRRQLLATEIANRIINRLGPIIPFEIAEEEGVEPATIAKAFVAADQLLDMGAIWREIESAQISEAARVEAFERASIGLRGHLADLVRAGVAKLHPSALANEIAQGWSELTSAARTILGGEARAQADAMLEELSELDVPKKLAEQVVQLFVMDGAVGLARLSRSTKLSPSSLAMAFARLGSELGLGWAQSNAALMEPSDIWERLLVAGLARDYQQMRLDFLSRLMDKADAKADPVRAVMDWCEANAQMIRQFKSTIVRARANTAVTPAVLAQIASQARNLLDE
ncbi:MAG: NAD-glutamate dehydrogenase domain-containing protein [Erythrobacter sp.]